MDKTREALQTQFGISWALASYHLTGLSDEEIFWRPCSNGPHVHQTSSNSWEVDWPTDESYAAGAPSGAWVMWHIVYWWSMVIDHSFGAADLSRQNIEWPGGAELARETILDLKSQWVEHLGTIDDATFHSTELSRWPKSDCTFVDIVAWVNLELMKNASELGYCRFLYATRA